MKTCATCKQEKTDDAFRGKRGDCRECEREKHRAWYAKQETNTEGQITIAKGAEGVCARWINGDIGAFEIGRTIRRF